MSEIVNVILARHKAEFPFEESEENRDRYYWLSGFLHACFFRGTAKETAVFEMKNGATITVKAGSVIEGIEKDGLVHFNTPAGFCCLPLGNLEPVK